MYDSRSVGRVKMSKEDCMNHGGKLQGKCRRSSVISMSIFMTVLIGSEQCCADGFFNSIQMSSTLAVNHRSLGTRDLPSLPLFNYLQAFMLELQERNLRIVWHQLLPDINGKQKIFDAKNNACYKSPGRFFAECKTYA